MKAQERALRRNRGKGKWRSIALAVLFHALFIGLIIFGVRWQTQSPEAVQVGIVTATQSAPTPPASEPEQPVAPEVTTKVAPKPAPVEEPKVEPKPDLVIEKPKAKPKAPVPDPEEAKLKKAAEEKAAKLEKAKEEKEAKDKEAKEKLAKDKSAKEKVAKEQAAKETADKEAKAKEQADENAQKMIRDLQKQAGAATGVAKGATTGTPDPNWEGRVKGAIRRNTVFSNSDVDGNPEAVFRVDLNPDCTVRGVRLIQSSKSPAWDQAAERAIRRTDPFPKPAGQDCRAQETIGHRPE